MRISILLPYKENFSSNYAGAVSLFVKDSVKNSKYFDTSYVFGSMDYKKPFLKKNTNDCPRNLTPPFFMGINRFILL